MPPQRRRACALGFEIGELAPLVARIAREQERQARDREEERDERTCGERDQ